MKSIRSRSNVLTLFSVCALAVLLSACAPSVKVRSDTDPEANMSAYRSYDFFSQMGIEGEGYSNLLGQHFRDAISAQMDARGLAKSGSPQLQINVSIGAEEKVRVNTYQEPYLYGGYYGMGGYGHYGSPWGYGGGATRTTVHQYTEANVYIDMVDATEHKMVWQGVATFTLTEKMQGQMRETVNNTVEKVFSQFPVPNPSSG
ncbi:MAG: DUF4136 domain-containing protein [Xanthomonadales bacterium]|nr:DUF4136 domain-containing protein [Gammaproteobacteria bacterium]MBT8055147.1 DUF4136 domain-containing protein [Gammaproteobacteria bacterium]NND58364.1 DUF4136 domain-containing protein [Xanthomonadales bacterium]NNK51741.1 DUF4136 domain-containing protein [Xanthomonadales bacterium]